MPARPSHSLLPCQPLDPLPSNLAAEKHDLVVFFLDELIGQVEDILDGWESGELGHVQHVVRRIRGAAAGFGYPAISSAAEQAEIALQDQWNPSLPDSSSIDVEPIKRLLALCCRALEARVRRAA